MANFWEKAKEALKVAEWAYQNRYYNEAVSRSYFAALRAALALLEAIGFRATETKRIHFGFNQLSLGNAFTGVNLCPHIWQ